MKFKRIRKFAEGGNITDPDNLVDEGIRSTGVPKNLIDLQAILAESNRLKLTKLEEPIDKNNPFDERNLNPNIKKVPLSNALDEAENTLKNRKSKIEDVDTSNYKVKPSKEELLLKKLTRIFDNYMKRVLQIVSNYLKDHDYNKYLKEKAALGLQPEVPKYRIKNPLKLN